MTHTIVQHDAEAVVPGDWGPIGAIQRTVTLQHHVSAHMTEPAIFAPCLVVDDRFILGKLLGSVYEPPGIVPDHGARTVIPLIARFCLDLSTCTLIEARFSVEGSFGVVVHTRDVKEYILGDIHLQQEYCYLGSTGGVSMPFLPVSVPPRSWGEFVSNYDLYFPVGQICASVVEAFADTPLTSHLEHISISTGHPAVEQYALPELLFSLQGSGLRLALRSV